MADNEEGLISTGQQLMLFVSVAVLSVLPGALHLLGVTLKTGAADYRTQLFEAMEGAVEPISYGLVQGMTAYTMLEWSVVVLTMATAALAYAHFHVKNGTISLIISIGAFWTGAITAFQLLAFHGFSIQVVNPGAFVQFNWTVGQGFIGLLFLGASAMVLWRGERREQFSPGHLAAVVVVASALAYLIIFQTAQAPELPISVRSDELVSRPYDLIPLGLFVVAAVGVLPALHRMCQSIFSMALWLSAVPLIVSQLHMAFVSGQVFDAPFTWAQLAKVTAFGIIFGGLVWDYFRVCRTEVTLEEQLSVSDRRFRMFFNNSDEAIIVFDVDCRIEDMNPKASEMFGLSAEEARGRDVAELLFWSTNGDTAEHRQAFRRRLRLFEESEESDLLKEIRDVVVEPPEGGELNLQYHTVPASEQGRSIFAVMARDVTERKELQMRMFQMDRLVAAGTLAAGVVHEIKNPMTYVTTNLGLARETVAGIRGEVESLEDEFSDVDGLLEPLDEFADEIDEALEAAEEGSHRVQQIVDDMRVFSRTGEVATEPISICEAAEIALRMTRGKVQPHATIETNFDDDVPLVDADETRLSQVFVNLIVNAAQAMEKEQADDHRLRVCCTSTSDRAVVRVEDTGPGMSQGLQSKIFRPFFTTKSAGEGTGLGLPLSKSIIDKFGGEIEVDSTPGVGTTFEVRLPFSDCRSPGESGERATEQSS